MLKEAFGEQALSQALTSVWLKRFKNGQQCVENENILVEYPHAQLRK